MKTTLSFFRPQLIFLLYLLILTSILPLHAQGPDRLPVPSYPESHLMTSTTGKQVADSLLAPNVLLFCGQEVNLDPTFRQRRLRRELAQISPYAPTLMERASYFFPMVEPILESSGVPEDFKYLMVIESGMNPNARSPKGALGLWQFMEATAKEYGLAVSRRIDERRDVEKSTRAACRYILAAYAKFGDWVATAQSYNSGQGRISTELERQQVDEAIDLKLAEETERYIYRILAAKIVFTHPENFAPEKTLFYYRKIRRR